MSSLTKPERDKQKLIQDKCQTILSELLRDEDNKYCVDCDSKGPRWASWNLGIFLCIRCAGIHRNLGVHISKVKSVNLDSWTPEQVGAIQNMGNSKARAVYEANLPDSFCRPQADTALESFIRAKYEHKKYIAKEWVETPPKPAFDIETELKKEKEKKKNKIKPIAPISSQTEIQSNPIPRPVANVNGKIGTEKAHPVAPKPVPPAETASADLLSLDIGGGPAADSFGLFASASDTSGKVVPATGQPSKTLDDEEKDFFSQKVESNKSDQNGGSGAIGDGKKLTKESILSLYSQTPNTGAGSLNGFPPATSLVQTNQFSNVNPLFTNNQATTLMSSSSTNPFLTTAAATTTTNPLLVPGNDFHSQAQQQSLVQGLSSLHLPGSIPVPIVGIPPVMNTQSSHLNWFSSPPLVPAAVPSAATGMMANPFISAEQTTKIGQAAPAAAAKPLAGDPNPTTNSGGASNDWNNLNFW